MQMSVDGLVAAQKPHLKWQLWDWGSKCPWDEQLKLDFNTIFASIDIVLLSRKMVKAGFIDHWTAAADKFKSDPSYDFARRIVHVEKVVVTSKSMKSTWDRTTVFKGDLSKEVERLKRQKGKDIIAFGGVKFASALISESLVDEVQFFINPAVICNGSSIFKGEVDGLRMKLKQSKSYDCGIVVNRYKPTASFR